MVMMVEHIEEMVMPKVYASSNKGFSHQILQGRVSSSDLHIEVQIQKSKHPVIVN